jgi:hypothetical protein
VSGANQQPIASRQWVIAGLTLIKQHIILYTSKPYN